MYDAYSEYYKYKIGDRVTINSNYNRRWVIIGPDGRGLTNASLNGMSGIIVNRYCRDEPRPSFRYLIQIASNTFWVSEEDIHGYNRVFNKLE